MNGLTRKLKKKFKNTWKEMKMKHNSPKCLGCRKGSPERTVHCNSVLSQEARKVPNTQHLKELEKEQQIKPKASRRREITQIKGPK